MKIRARNLDTHKKSSKIAVAIVGILIVIYGSGITRVSDFDLLYLSLGILLTLSTLLIKNVYVDEYGLSIFYNMRISTYSEKWAWADIYAVTWQKDTKKTNLWLIYFTNGDRTKKFYFNEDEKDLILEMAKSNNSKIKIYKALRDK